MVSYPTRLLTPAPGQTERDLTEFWEATARCIREVMAAAGIRPDEVACVACCGHGKGLYLIDREGLLWRTGLFPPIPGRTSTLPSGTGTARRSGCGS